IGFRSGGWGPGGWAWLAAWTPAVTLLEMTSARPLAATAVSVGIVRAPPVPPERPSSCASNAAVVPGGAGAGLEGAAPIPDTVTPKPGRVIVCETLAPVTVTPLP